MWKWKPSSRTALKQVRSSQRGINNITQLRTQEKVLTQTKQSRSTPLFNMRTLVFLCGIVLFAGLMQSSRGFPSVDDASDYEVAGTCPDLENVQWTIGQCDQCYCRNKEVYCKTNCVQWYKRKKKQFEDHALHAADSIARGQITSVQASRKLCRCY